MKSLSACDSKLTGYGSSNETEDTRRLKQSMVINHVAGSEQDQGNIGSAQQREQDIVRLASTDREDNSDDEPRPDEKSNGL